MRSLMYVPGPPQCIMLAIVLVLAIVTELEAQNQVQHPQDQFLVRPIPVSASISLMAEPDRDHPLNTVLTQSPAQTTIGMLDGPTDSVFGMIEDVAVDAAGRIYVLDAQNHNVKIYDSNGKWIQRVGGKGRGPGELDNPRALTIGPQGQLVVLDLPGVHLFRWEDTVLRYDHSFPFFSEMAAEPTDACTIGETLYVHGPGLTPGGLVYPFLNGRVGSSFGWVYDADEGLAVYHTNRYRMACAPDARIVALAPRGLIGEIHAYTPAGDPAWIAVLEGFRPVEFVQRARGTSTRIPQEGYDRLYTLVDVGGDAFLAQVAYRSHEDYQLKNELTTLRSFIVDARTGELTALGTEVPRILAFGDGFFVSATNDPFPQIGIHKW